VPISEKDAQRINLSMPVANDLKLGDLLKALQEASGGGEIEVSWSGITGKPSTFPPATHTHDIANVNGLQNALDALQAEIDALKGEGGA
jgi:hypothetical protein